MPYTIEQIVDQLRQLAHPSAHTSDYAKARLLEAAVEIERLRQSLALRYAEIAGLASDIGRRDAEIARLRALIPEHIMKELDYYGLRPILSEKDHGDY